MPELKDILKALMISSNGQMLDLDDFIRAMPDQEVTIISVALKELKEEGGDTYDIIEIQGNYFARTKLDFVEYIQRLKGVQSEPKQRRALIETLAVIAMRQPISRSEIEDLRCVQLNVGILHDLQDYGWVKVVKVTSNDTHLYGTTLKFLQDFGLSSIREAEAKLLKVENIL
jgi:segregation and condensation protein B